MTATWSDMLEDYSLGCLSHCVSVPNHVAFIMDGNSECATLKDPTSAVAAAALAHHFGRSDTVPQRATLASANAAACRCPQDALHAAGSAA